jgi:hypothetical protein
MSMTILLVLAILTPVVNAQENHLKHEFTMENEDVRVMDSPVLLVSSLGNNTVVPHEPKPSKSTSPPIRKNSELQRVLLILVVALVALATVVIAIRRYMIWLNRQSEASHAADLLAKQAPRSEASMWMRNLKDINH